MGLPGGFRESVFSGAGHHQTNRRLEADSVTNRNVNRFDPGSGAEHGADDFVPIPQWDPGAAPLRDRTVISEKSRLANPDGGGVRYHAQVTRKAEASWMSEPLTVAQNEVGPDR